MSFSSKQSNHANRVSRNVLQLQPQRLLRRLLVAFTFASGITCATSVQLFAQEPDASPFRPRTDAKAAEDTRELRERLSRMRDSKGSLDPLGQFLRHADSQSLSVKDGLVEPDRLQGRKSVRDPESERRPELKSSPSDYKSYSDASDFKVSSGLRLLPAPRWVVFGPTVSVQPANYLADQFQPVRAVSTAAFESAAVHSTTSPVSLASGVSGVPVYDTQNIIARYQDIPGGNGGIPPVGPMAGSIAGPPMFPNAQPPNILPNQPTMSTPAFPPAGQSNILPPQNPPAALPSYQPMVSAPQNIGVPLSGVPSGLSGPAMVAPGPVLTAPQAFYPNNVAPPVQYSAPPNQYSAPANQGQMISPSDAGMPRYTRQPNFVNSQPFVSAPPNQFDACYMVSPSVYRQAYNNPCDGPGGGTGYMGGANNGRTGSPFSYVPPTFMPSNLYRSPPYPILLGFGQNLDGAYFSRGIVGQPKAYLDGQPIRNFLRYLTP